MPVRAFSSTESSSKRVSSTFQPLLLASAGSMPSRNFQRAKRFSTLKVARRIAAMTVSSQAGG